MSRRRRTILVSFLLAATFVNVLMPRDIRAEKKGDCDRSDVDIIYDAPSELEAACSALTDVMVYFRRMGFDMAPKVSLRFVDRDASRSFEQIASHGFFNAPQSQIVVYRTSDVGPWGLVWSTRLAASFLRHELIHMAIWQIAGQRQVRLGREWHEFIAYAIQLDLMDAQLLNELLAKYAETPAVEHLEQINEFTYGMNPEVFAVAAYKTYLAKGAAKFVAQLLRAEVLPPPMSYPFPVMPDRERLKGP